MRRLVGVVERVAPKWTEQKAFEVWGRPQRPPAKWGGLLANARKFELDVGDRNLPAWEWNPGAAKGTVLLVHGWSGNASQMGSYVEPLTKQGWHVVAFDMPAHGEATGNFCTLPLMTQVVATIVTKLQPKVIVAHSLGATATTWAMTKGPHVEKVALLAPPGRMPPFLTHFTRLAGLSDAMRDRLLARVETIIRAPISEMDLVKHAPTLGDVEALLIHDVNDEVVPVESSRELVASWPGAQLVETAKLGHDRIRRNASVVDQVINFVTTEHKAATGPTQLAS
ncbi:MAG: alpha/beta hydrolase [Archangium sp.]